MQIYDDKKKKIATLSGFRERTITTTLDTGDKELSFQYPANGLFTEALKEEYYIRTKTDEFVIKAVEKSDNWNKYTAVLNVEELEGTQYPYGFESNEQTITDCLTFAFEDTGWSIGTCTVNKRRTIDEDGNVSAWDILQKCLKIYRCECVIDSLNKIINIFEQIGSDKGCYFIEGLNLRKLSIKSDSYDFFTRIYPIGKDGITPEWVIGHEYIDNNQYSSKIKSYVWKDERYTNTTSLIEDATAKLEEMAKPYVAYTADVADLAAANPVYKDILSYAIGDTVTLISKKDKIKEKQRIVKITEHPETPEKNTVELSNAKKTFAQMQQEETEKSKTEAISIANKSTKKILENYSTTAEIETKIIASQTAIELGVRETLSSYVTTTTYDAEIRILSDSISSKVEKDDFGTLITQNPDNVKIAWNKNSNYIQFESGGITLYNGDIDSNQRRTVFNHNGNHFYRDGYYIGMIGTNNTTGYENYKGLVFDLEYEASYMAWAYQERQNDVYQYKWMYRAKTSPAGSEVGLHAYADINMHNYKIKNVSWEDGGITGTMEFKMPKNIESDGKTTRYTHASLEFKNGILINATW